MPCDTTLPFPGGGFAIICGGRRRKMCSACGLREGTRLCDGPAPTVRAAKQTTCDAPLCTRCRRLFVVDGNKVDYCPSCARRHIETKQAGSAP